MDSISMKNIGIFLKYGALLFFLIIIYRLLSNEDINNDDSIFDGYSEMLKDNEHKIIMDWTPKAACSAMVHIISLNFFYYYNN